MNTIEPGAVSPAPAAVNTWIRGADVAKSTCSILGCEHPALARGWCNTHYHRWLRRGGDPTTPSKRQPVDPVSRFWPKVTKTSTCWVWTAGLFTGYGQFFDGRRSVPAHRFAYELLIGPIPAGLELDHLCRNRACVNPAHLEPVTPKVNYLRGEGALAKNARKTHCLRGHPLSGDNLLLDTNGGRRCRECKRARA